MVALVARAFCARPAVMMFRVIAVMQLVAHAWDLNRRVCGLRNEEFRSGTTREELTDDVARHEGIFGL
jgi:hypothetical protein